MKYFLDTEFIDNGKVIDLISIGIVAEDSRTYYAESATYNELNACPWVAENVIKHLTGPVKTRPVIKQHIIDFIGTDNNVEFWAYYGAYDWVCFCQLFGRMLDLPKGWPQYFMDLKQLSELCGGIKYPEQKTPKHHALNDALWNKQAHDWIAEYVRV